MEAINFFNDFFYHLTDEQIFFLNKFEKCRQFISVCLEPRNHKNNLPNVLILLECIVN